MGHQRDYSEEVAARIDGEIRSLIERAHDEAWEILVEHRDVLDDLVLKLFDKETVGKEELAEIFASVPKRPARVFDNSKRIPPIDRPPVLTPAELALLGPADVEGLQGGNGSARNGSARTNGARANGARANGARAGGGAAKKTAGRRTTSRRSSS
jgi:cell division protease FtsH